MYFNIDPMIAEYPVDRCPLTRWTAEEPFAVVLLREPKPGDVHLHRPRGRGMETLDEALPEGLATSSVGALGLVVVLVLHNSNNTSMSEPLVEKDSN